MAVLVDTLYGEKCCNKDIEKISYEICKQCKWDDAEGDITVDVIWE